MPQRSQRHAGACQDPDHRGGASSVLGVAAGKLLPDHRDERSHLARDQIDVLRRCLVIVGAARRTEGRVPSVRKMLEAPQTRRTFGDRDVGGLDGADDPAAVQDRVGGFVWVGVALRNVRLQMLQLAVEVDLELEQAGGATISAGSRP